MGSASILHHRNTFQSFLGHGDRADAYHAVHAMLNRSCPPFLVNEADIVGVLEALERTSDRDTAVYWLLVARLVELVLLCAGHYADNCEFTAAGDLLVNPRRIEIHCRGVAGPIVKHRHGRLSDQLRRLAPLESQDGVHLKRAAWPMITQPAILPHLNEMMHRSERFDGNYLRSITVRMQQIADTIGFLIAGSFWCAQDLQSRRKTETSSFNRFVDAHLCRFDASLYDRLGRQIDALLSHKGPFQ
jgi:hypothetical protein